MSSPKELFKAWLAEHGVPPNEATKHGFTLTRHLERNAVCIAYFDRKGKPTGFNRWRFLDAQEPRYLQPPGTGVQVYFPPNGEFSESRVPELRALAKSSMTAQVYEGFLDQTTPALQEAYFRNHSPTPLPDADTYAITEGEMKAYAACTMGINTIGIGGVHMFRSKDAYDAPLHPDIIAAVPPRARINIIFDPELAWRADLRRAERGLASALQTYANATPYIVRLPGSKGEPQFKLDDLIATGHQQVVVDAITAALPYASMVLLAKIDESCTYSVSDDKVFIRGPRAYFSCSPAAWERACPVHGFVPGEKQNQAGKFFFWQESAARTWLSSEYQQRASVHLAPVVPELPSGPYWNPQKQQMELNRWMGLYGALVSAQYPGPSTMPKEFLTHIDHLFTDSEVLTCKLPHPEHPHIKFSSRVAVLYHVAWLIQNPGKKINFMLLLGDCGRTGKGLFADIVGDVVGNAYTSPLTLSGLLTGWADARRDMVLCILDEYEKSKDVGRRDLLGTMKSIITELSFFANMKGSKATTATRCFMNIIGLTNHPELAPLDPEDDARVFIPEMRNVKADTSTLDYRKFKDTLGQSKHDAWLGQLYRALMAVKVPAWYGYGGAPRSPMLTLAMSAAQGFTADVLTVAMEINQPGVAYVTTHDLRSYIPEKEQHTWTAQRIGTGLRNAGWAPVPVTDSAQKGQVYTPDKHGTTTLYYNARELSRAPRGMTRAEWSTFYTQAKRPVTKNKKLT